MAIRYQLAGHGHPVLRWPSMAIRSHVSRPWPSGPALASHGHKVPHWPSMAIRCHVGQPWPSRRTSVGHDHPVPRWMDMAIRNSIKRPWPCRTLGHGHAVPRRPTGLSHGVISRPTGLSHAVLRRSTGLSHAVPRRPVDSVHFHRCHVADPPRPSTNDQINNLIRSTKKLAPLRKISNDIDIAPFRSPTARRSARAHMPPARSSVRPPIHPPVRTSTS